jgi:beta-lactamase superfamily II metal-dependent hydrolase
MKMQVEASVNRRSCSRRIKRGWKTRLIADDEETAAEKKMLLLT